MTMACAFQNLAGRPPALHVQNQHIGLPLYLHHRQNSWTPPQSVNRNHKNGSFEQNDEISKILDFTKLERDIMNNVLNDELEEKEEAVEQELNTFPSFNYAPTPLPSIFKRINPILKLYPVEMLSYKHTMTSQRAVCVVQEAKVDGNLPRIPPQHIRIMHQPPLQQMGIPPQQPPPPIQQQQRLPTGQFAEPAITYSSKLRSSTASKGACTSTCGCVQWPKLHHLMTQQQQQQQAAGGFRPTNTCYADAILRHAANPLLAAPQQQQPNNNKQQPLFTQGHHQRGGIPAAPAPTFSAAFQQPRPASGIAMPGAATKPPADAVVVAMTTAPPHVTAKELLKQVTKQRLAVDLKAVASTQSRRSKLAQAARLMPAAARLNLPATAPQPQQQQQQQPPPPPPAPQFVELCTNNNSERSPTPGTTGDSPKKTFAQIVANRGRR